MTDSSATMSTQRVLQIRFRYEGSYSQFEPSILEYARQIEHYPALLWKLWCNDEENREGCGIYLFADEASVREYAAFMVPQMQTIALDVEAHVYAYHEAASAITRAPVALPA